MNETLVRAFLGPNPAVGLFAGFLYVNLAVGAAVAVVAVARIPARRLMGPAAAYQLWIFPLIAALLATLLVFVPSDTEAGSLAAAAELPGVGIIAPAWAFVAAAIAAAFTIAQLRFVAEMRAGRGGPAVVGLIAPRMVLPRDDGSYTPEERELIRAHEREHVARKDPRAAAIVAAFQCLCWFNPFAHLAAYLLRLDQELACDAAVILHRPTLRALYARTLLKTQLAAQPLPFGCYWPARGVHPLEVRVGMLKPRPGAIAQAPAQTGERVVLALADPIRP